MAFLRTEKKKSGTYLRIVESYKLAGRPKHRTIHSLGKAEDYPPHQLENIAKKFLELAGMNMGEIIANSFHETNRLNYGYALVIKKMWKMFQMDVFVNMANSKARHKFDWEGVLQLMIAERLNEPCSKLQSFSNQNEYIGFSTQTGLQHFYRTLDILNKEQEALKVHLFKQQRNLFAQDLDVVFYDVTTLYFDSQIEKEGNIRKKGYSKDGKAHKTQVVLGLLVDKMRNPISYDVYEGNTYEGHTMIKALKKLKKHYLIDRCIVVADSAMIDKDNRDYITCNELDYILGERIKNLPKEVKTQLLDKTKHNKVFESIGKEKYSYTQIEYKGRRIICTYSEKRAKKDAHEREKLIDKAKNWIANPSKYKQVKKRGAGRFINTDQDGFSRELDLEKINMDAQYDGFKAIATTTKLGVAEIVEKYRDLFEVEHAFRTLKSQLEIRPVFHWTNARIQGHIAMCFLSYTFLNYLRNATQLQYRQIIKALDKMQMSEIKEDNKSELLYMRSNVNQDQSKIFKQLKIPAPKDITPSSTVNQYFK
ncbi:MAG: IS1634 family transposase [Bacteroidetes bacterium]|nr:IS1634 family transposase [Bacteroidota bacterium]